MKEKGSVREQKNSLSSWLNLIFPHFFVFQSQEQSNILNSNTKGQSRVSAL